MNNYLLIFNEKLVIIFINYYFLKEMVIFIFLSCPFSCIFFIQIDIYSIYFLQNMGLQFMLPVTLLPL